MAETTVSEYTQFLQKIAANPTLVKAYSKLLKSAGYFTGNVTDKYTPALQKAFDSLEADRLSISKVRPMTRDVFLNERVAEGSAAGTSGTTTNRQRYVASPTQASALLDSISQDLIGRKLSDVEKKKYMAILKAEQKKPESATVTTTTTTAGAAPGSGVSSGVTTGGLDEQQFLIEKIAATDEAKANKVLNAYSTVLNMLGGLR